MSTPEESFWGKKLDLAHFWIFGALVYCHVSKDARKNIELTVDLGIFVGYTNAPHNYRVYLPSHKMKFVHRGEFQ